MPNRNDGEVVKRITNLEKWLRRVESLIIRPTGSGTLHNEVTVTDTATVNLTLTGQNIQADLIGGGSAHVIKDEGGAGLPAQPNLNFTGAGVTATNNAGTSATDITVAGGGHTIEEEGSSLTQRTKLNFVGAGVTVTDDAGDDASVVTIPSPSLQIDQSGGTSDTYGVLAGLVNGANALYTVSLGVYITGSLTVYLNGQLQTQGTGEDWVETTPGSGTFTFNIAPDTGSLITVMYGALSIGVNTYIGARYSTNAGQSIPNNSVTIIDFEDVDYDTDSAVTTGAAWKFTAPETGYYHVSINILYSSTDVLGVGESAWVGIRKEGVGYSIVYTENPQATATRYYYLGGSDTIYLTAGQYIQIATYQFSGSAMTLHDSGLYNYVSISKIG